MVGLIMYIRMFVLISIRIFGIRLVSMLDVKKFIMVRLLVNIDSILLCLFFWKYWMGSIWIWLYKW